MTAMSALAAGLLWWNSSAAAQEISTHALRLALIQDVPYSIGMTLKLPLEHLIREARSSAAVATVEVTPAWHSGERYRFELPKGLSVSTRALALVTDQSATLISPPLPDLAEALARATREPWTWLPSEPIGLRVSTKPAVLALESGPRGEPWVAASLGPEGPLWSQTAATVYRLYWDGQEAMVALVGQSMGGLGRLATALSRERERGPILGVSPGGVFGGFEEPKGRALAELLEGLGLSHAAVTGEDLLQWEEIASYRRDRPGGIQLLSANLVYSTAPSMSYFPSYAILESSGLRVAVVGFTSPSAEKELRQAGLGFLTILPVEKGLLSVVTALAGQADLVVGLAALDKETRGLRVHGFGLDILVGEHDHALRPAGFAAVQEERDNLDSPLWILHDTVDTLTLLEAVVAKKPGGRRGLRISERHVRLDDLVAPAAGYPGIPPESLGIVTSTGPPLIPSARRIFPSGSALSAGQTRIGSHEFWNMASSLLAHELSAELALLEIRPGPAPAETITEEIVRHWLQTRDPAVTVRLSGAQARALVAEAERQIQVELQGLPHGAKVHFTAGGLGRGHTVHGAAIDDKTFYRVATSQSLAAALDLPGPREPDSRGRTIDQIVLEALREQAKRAPPPSSYRRWMEGRPVRVGGVWTIHFRDVGLNIQNTKVVRDDAFAGVPHSRVQGFDERTVGLVFKTDVEYLRGPYKWLATSEIEYARTRLQPRGQPPVTNTTADRLTLRTMGTRRAGAIAAQWLARSWGPSLGLQFDGEFEPEPGLRRREIYSAFPGLEFYDGSVVRTLELSGNLKRDLTRDPPNTQYGLRLRTVVSKAVGPGGAANLQGELFTNYFVLTKKDLPQDLRVEGNATVKLRIPVRKHLTVAPFFDFYFFELKVKPVWAYSAMTGITIGFSRLWKPQYERF